MEREDIYQYSKDIPYYQFEPWLKQRLEWFKDQKFGLFMHWGIYSVWGICESWPLVPGEYWVRGDSQQWRERNKNYEQFARDYRALNQSFNPEYFEPEVWSRLAKNAGMKYVCFTTKHHDGFCMWDTQTTDFKITSPETPFHSNPRADLVRAVFDTFRKEDMAIWAYFSKSDWHTPYYWSPDFDMKHCGRNPNYDRDKHPEIWEKFVRYTHAQIREILGNYGKIDCLWLDGGQVAPVSNQDIRMDEIAQWGRELQPELLIADRTVGGPHENFITPEQTIPAEASEIPWESCITMGNGFAYYFNDTYKSATECIRLLLEVIAKGGNLLLNVAPSPEGRFDTEAVRSLIGIADWMKINSEAVHGTRPIAPYAEGPVRFTQNNGKVYASCLYESGRPNNHLEVVLKELRPVPGSKVHMLGYKKEIHWEDLGDRCILYLPELEHRPCQHAWVFVFEHPSADYRSA